MTDFIFFILYQIFNLVILLLIVTAIMSWLVAFNIINTRNPGVGQFVDVLQKLSTPILAPFRMIIPPIGGIDISFIIAFIVIQAIQRYLLPLAEANVRMLIG